MKTEKQTSNAHQPRDDEQPQWQLVLHKIQEKSFIVIIFGVLTISIVQHFLPPLVAEIEVAILVIAVILAAGIGAYWLIDDFLGFRKSYLKMLDDQDETQGKDKRDE